MPDWVEPVLRAVTTVLLLVVLAMLIRNDLRLRATASTQQEIEAAQAETSRKLRGDVCYFEGVPMQVGDSTFGAGDCSGRYERRVIAGWGKTRTLKTCDAHSLTAVNYVHALAEDGVDR